ncbi:MAG: hypothetical protein F4X31_12225 [Gammaproteobacteria bacterium]|nr:hypothetical protein [Gammaproteobacteria bacterium]MYF50920.1 hypothetical protein [Gammaproteobacteria bacterium]MYH15944.1 hypothetical protein [Gammaproteobacteria bacterium]MYK82106.1 hypothetical protein [Gammaproteobacteria bacterium]
MPCPVPASSPEQGRPAYKRQLVWIFRDIASKLLSKAARSVPRTGQCPRPNRPNPPSPAAAISHNATGGCRLPAYALSLYRFPNTSHWTWIVTIPEGHDRAAKRLLGDARVIADALRAFVPGSWVARLDLGTLRPLPAEHVNAELHRRRGDLLWTAELKGGGAVVIILEAQSTPDPHMPARMMTLTGLVCEGFAAEAWGPDGRTPAVLPIVLYTGLRRWTPALDLAERAGPPSELSAYVAGPRYLLLDVRTLAKQDLPERNLMAAFVRIETADSPEALADALRGTLAWLGDDELGLAFVRWVSDVLMPLRFPDADRGLIEDLKEGMTMLAERAKQWTEQWFAEGRETGLREGLEQGLVQGLEQGRRDMAVRLARLKFGDDTAERLSPLLDRIADPAALAEVGDWVIQCSDAAELLTRAENAASSGNGRSGL